MCYLSIIKISNSKYYFRSLHIASEMNSNEIIIYEPTKLRIMYNIVTGRDGMLLLILIKVKAYSALVTFGASRNCGKRETCPA